MRRDPSYGKVVEKTGWTRWIWVTWAFLASSLLMLSTAILTTMINVNQHQSYPGSLQSRVQETELTLLQGIPLKEVLVQNGELVSVGQTLALIDEDRLRILVDELQRNILADNILRKCLQSGESPTQEVLEDEDLDAETRLKLGRAAAECQSFHDRNKVQIRRILQAERYLEEEHGRKIRNLKLAAQSVVDTTVQTRIAVQIAMELSSNALKVGQVEIELAALLADHKRELVATLRALEQSVAYGRLRKTALEPALSSPRLYAPRNGTVSDLRAVQLGKEYLQDVRLLKIGDAETIEFIPSFSIPRAQATMLKIGDLVSISVLGNQIGSLQLSGEIMEMEDTVDVGNGQPLIQVIVQLDNPSLALINAPFNSKQFSGRNSRSEIHFTLPDIGLSKFLIRATGDLLMSNVRL